jgi:uncharacterized iron-regulated membrane protein
MKAIRSVLFWTHLSAGMLGGVVILVMSFTGVALALRPQIQNWIDSDVRYVAPVGQRLAPHDLLMRVQNAKGEAPQSLALVSEADVAALVGLPGEGNVYVNPYTGEILGKQSERAIAFFQSMVSWHRYMGAEGESRATGRAWTGASNLGFLVLGLTGLYIWWPKQLTARHLRPIVWFRSTSTAKARDFNWHNTIGFWCLIPIVIMTASGAVISYPWATNLVYRLSGSPVPPARGAGPGGGGAAAEGRGGGGAAPAAARAVIPDALNQVVAAAERQVPTWQQLSFRLPTRAGGPVSFTIVDGAQWNDFARSQLTVNSATAEVAQWQPYEAQNRGQKVRGWLRFAHTGELGGLLGQIVAGIGCLGGMFLVYTGLALAYRRLVNWSLWARVGIGRRSRTETAAAQSVADSV